MSRFLSLNRHYKEKYNNKVAKLSLDGGRTCPNRDGTISSKGCIFCSESGSGDFTYSDKDLLEQIKKQKQIARRKWDVNHFVAYFQSFTNTYGNLETLDNMYSLVLEDPEIIGISIATRADCLDEDVIALLSKYNKITDLTLEIGLQTIHEETVKYINRGYDHNTLDKGLKNLRDQDIKYLLQIIFGLPGESQEDMLETIDYVNSVKPYGVKIHSLYIQNDAPIYKSYLDEGFEMLSKDEYTDLVVEAIGKLSPNIVIERMTGDGDKDKLIAPMWSADKLSVLGEIQSKMARRDIYQGKNYKGD